MNTISTTAASVVIDSLKRFPEDWEFSDHYATNGEVRMWIANRPHADLTVGVARIGNENQRREIRRLIDAIVLERFTKEIGGVPPPPPPTTGTNALPIWIIWANVIRFLKGQTKL